MESASNCHICLLFKQGGQENSTVFKKVKFVWTYLHCLVARFYLLASERGFCQEVGYLNTVKVNELTGKKI